MEYQLDDLVELKDNADPRLSEWEFEFIESIEERVAKGVELTTLQEEKIDEIWEKLFQ